MRQSVTSMSGLFVSAGLLVEYAAGPWLSYEYIIMVSALPSLLFAVAWIRLKESPYHLIAKGKRKEATDVLLWLRGASPGIHDEFIQIEVTVITLIMILLSSFDNCVLTENTRNKKKKQEKESSADGSRLRKFYRIAKYVKVNNVDLATIRKLKNPGFEESLCGLAFVSTMYCIIVSYKRGFILKLHFLV